MTAKAVGEIKNRRQSVETNIVKKEMILEMTHLG